jgi:hypothetical protein
VMGRTFPSLALRARVWLAIGAGVAMAVVAAVATNSLRAEPAPVTFPLSVGIVDPDSKAKLPPYIVMFEGGVDEKGRDVRRALGRLEAVRGASKMFPESNQNPGLPVVLRGLRFSSKQAANGAMIGYDVELLGEFNAVRVPVAPNDMKSFLAGERTTFVLTGEKNYGVFSYVSSVKMEVELRGNELFVYRIDGDFSFREGLRTHVSRPKKLGPPNGREYLYRGEKAVLPELPVI